MNGNFLRYSVMLLVCVIILFTSTILVFRQWTSDLVSRDTPVTLVPTLTVEPFPVSVNAKTKVIEENPGLNTYLETFAGFNTNINPQQRFLDKALSLLAQSSLFQQLASSVSRILVIYPGERAEEVTKNFGDILAWSTEDRAEFRKIIESTEPFLPEGKLFPGRYVVERKATPEMVADLVLERFATEILSRYTPEVSASVPLDQALIIASLLEREAYDFTDMRIISGVIWNRLFINMPLQLDATLQYAKGDTGRWWSKVNPADKFIESPYNTYENPGLPPYPIANPSVESVVAALNPRETDCMFYFHGPDAKFYCTETYEEHVAMLKEVYGQGR